MWVDMQDLAILFGVEYVVLNFVPVFWFQIILTVPIITLFAFRFFPDKIPNFIYNLVHKD